MNLLLKLQKHYNFQDNENVIFLLKIKVKIET